MASYMCAVSKVYDMFKEMPDDWYTPKRIKLFYEMEASAKKLDQETGQPDCEDPDKAKVKERIEKIREELEDDYRGMDHD